MRNNNIMDLHACTCILSLTLQKQTLEDKVAQLHHDVTSLKSQMDVVKNNLVHILILKMFTIISNAILIMIIVFRCLCPQS